MATVHSAETNGETEPLSCNHGVFHHNGMHVMLCPAPTPVPQSLSVTGAGGGDTRHLHQGPHFPVDMEDNTEEEAGQKRDWNVITDAWKTPSIHGVQSQESNVLNFHREKTQTYASSSDLRFDSTEDHHIFFFTFYFFFLSMV